MTRRSGAKANNRARGHGHVVGTTAAAGVLLVFGITPLTGVPPARADVLGAVIDEVFSPFMDAAANTVDWGAVLTPTAWQAFLDPVHWDDAMASLGTSVLGVGSADLAGGHVGAADSASTAGVGSLVHGLEQDWINSSLGTSVDGDINALWLIFGGSGMLIGNGAHGLAGGTLGEANGGAGGLLFGDGGNGATDAAGQGGAGGAAGLFGDGGAGGAGADGTAAGVAGGDGGEGGAGGVLMGAAGPGGAGGNGGAGADGGNGGAGGEARTVFGVGANGGAGGDGGTGATGGNGGDGGNGTGLFGVGGNGGAGGGGTNLSGLPALGGAGGNGGLFGSHGAVGHFGTDVTSMASTQAQTPSPDEPQVSAIGTTDGWLTNSNGQVVIYHGFDEVNKVAPFELSVTGFGNTDAAFLAANGFNFVRLGIIWAAVEPEPGVFNDAYLANIDQTVQILANHGIHVILDMHQDDYSSVFFGKSVDAAEGAPAWAVQTNGAPNVYELPNSPATDFSNPAENQAWDAFWSNSAAPNGAGLENDYAQMWEHVANYFKNNPDVAGFEIMNEPHPGNVLDELHLGNATVADVLGDPHFDAQELTPFYNQVDSAIRAVDPTTPVWFEPNELFDAGIPTHLGTVNDPNTVFSFHDYCYFSSLCPAEPDFTASEASAYAKAHHIPAMMTEFGATTNLTDINDEMHAADQQQVGWSEWAFSNAEIRPSPDEDLVLNAHLPPSGDNLHSAVLKTLAEPYPQVISGTPNSWSFENGTFQFSYSTEMASGQGSFPVGSQTDISTPAVEFPNGYQVQVTGGHVVSAADAPTLVIASDAGASTISVTVTPASGASG